MRQPAGLEWGHACKVYEVPGWTGCPCCVTAVSEFLSLQTALLKNTVSAAQREADGPPLPWILHFGSTTWPMMTFQNCLVSWRCLASVNAMPLLPLTCKTGERFSAWIRDKRIKSNRNTFTRLNRCLSALTLECWFSFHNRLCQAQNNSSFQTAEY